MRRGGESVLDAELECLERLPNNLQRDSHIEPQPLRLMSMKVVADGAGTVRAAWRESNCHLFAVDQP